MRAATSGIKVPTTVIPSPTLKAPSVPVVVNFVAPVPPIVGSLLMPFTENTTPRCSNKEPWLELVRGFVVDDSADAGETCIDHSKIMTETGECAQEIFVAQAYFVSGDVLLIH